jgi:hypothetical protein
MVYLIFVTSNPFAISLSNASYSGGKIARGLSAESVDIVKDNTTDLIRDANTSASEIAGGLSAESMDIAEE